MYSRRERGAISLFWGAALVGLAAVAAMAALYSMRYERNLFAEGWSRLTGAAGQAPAISAAQEAAKSAKLSGSGIRKCIVEGSVVYSNIECKANDPTSRKLELQDTHGFEAPKAPAPEPAQGSSPAALQEKMIEKATGQ
jgi:hypothetical protein